MNTKRHLISVSGIDVQVVRKDIKNLHLAVYPPDGHVRVAVPKHITDDNVRLAVISKLRWIKRQQADFEKQPRQSVREMVSGESHYFFGKRYLLEVVERVGRQEVIIKNNTRLQLFIKPGASTEVRERVLNTWYREQLKQCIPDLLRKWQPIVGKRVADWGIKKMKTKWGSCNIEARRIWLNLELAKKPAACLEYILVHELVHLRERHHNDHFRAHMDRLMPQWRVARDILNREPLAHESWIY